MRTKLSCLALAALLSGCSTITFENSAATSSGVESEQWHNVWAFDLVEGGQTVDVKEQCGNKEWSSVTTETTFLNGLTELFTSPVWHPETASIDCGR